MPVRFPVLRAAALLFLLFGLSTTGRIAVAQSSAELRLDDRSAVNTGIELERSRQWLSAIEHYEKAVEQFPDNQELQYGLRRSKIHFGIERRYNDTSFEAGLLRLSHHEALQLYDQVFEQIRVDYVEALSPTSFVAHGTESLYLALANEDFLRRNLPQADPNRINQLRRVLRDQYWNKPVAGTSAARQVIDDVCRLAQSTAGLPSGPVVMEYLFGGCNALDDYSNFLTKNRLEDLYGNIEGEFVGLGIEMKAEDGKGMLLVNVLPESPASEGGLLPGDHIINIDGIDCRNMSTDEAAKLLRGVSGSRVKLQVRRPASDRVHEGVFARRAVHVKSIPVAKIVDPQNGIGYIQMTGFQKSSAEELDEALASLQRQGMKALIWDLRGNPGGLLTAAVEVLDRFLDEGVIVSTRGRARDQNYSYSAHHGSLHIPLVLLVDGDSASASEIVAGALLDHHRGTIVGRQTYGKWSVQSIFPIRNHTGLRLTTAKFYSPNGHNLTKVGVKPHVLVELPETHTTAFRGPTGPDPATDPDLSKGLEVLQSRLTQR